MSEKQTLLQPLTYIPTDVQSAQDYELIARRFIPHPSYEYIAGGSGQEFTRKENALAFSKYKIYPRILRDVQGGATALRMLNRDYAHPIFLAPVAYQKLAHSLGEIETSRGAYASDACMIASTLSSMSLEDIAQSSPAEKWFQLYIQPEQRDTLDLIQRAETAGYSAIVLTVDASIRTPSLGALRAGFKMPDDCVAVNISGNTLPKPKELTRQQSRVFQGAMCEAPTWEHINWILSQTNLPLIVKGVLHPDDAVALKNLGCAGIIVSNHGGRSLDGVPASIDCLAAIRASLGDEYPVMFDGGIRSGLDIFKAIALGADAVLIGRLQVYALSVAGALGVAHVIRMLREELELCMAQAGCATLNDIRQACVKLN